MTDKEKKSAPKKLLLAVILLWVAIFLALAVIVALVLTGKISLGGSSGPQYAPLAKYEEGALANDFELDDANNGKQRLSNLRGKVVVINFWATWCVPCLEEMPMFQAYSEEYPQIAMLGIDQAESQEQVAPYLSKMGITYPILLDTNAKVSESYKIAMLPTTIFVDEQGMIRFRHYGIMSQDQFQYYLRKLAEGKAKALVLNNIANKLLKVACAIIRNNTCPVPD